MGLEHALGEVPLGRYPLGVSPDGVPLVGMLDISHSGYRGSPKSGSYTTPAELLADIFAWGAGGSGRSAASAAYAGGGASAGYSRLVLPAGTLVQWSVGGPTIGGGPASNGNPGSNTTVTVGGVTSTAQGGRGGSTVAAPRAFATGFQINRYGGGSMEKGEFGGNAGGVVGYDGGGAGGFTDIFPGLSGGDGMSYIGGGNGADYFGGTGGGGGGADGTNYGAWGGPGRVLILLYRI